MNRRFTQLLWLLYALVVRFKKMKDKPHARTSVLRQLDHNMSGVVLMKVFTTSNAKREELERTPREEV